MLVEVASPIKNIGSAADHSTEPSVRNERAEEKQDAIRSIVCDRPVPAHATSVDSPGTWDSAGHARSPCALCVRTL